MMVAIGLGRIAVIGRIILIIFSVLVTWFRGSTCQGVVVMMAGLRENIRGVVARALVIGTRTISGMTGRTVMSMTAGRVTGM